MKDGQKTWINTIIALAAVAIIIWLAPSPDYEARGILLPEKNTRPAITPDSVIQLQAPPAAGTVMGQINIEHHYPAPDDQAQKQIGQLAQKLAADVGANAIVVNNFRLGAVTRSHYIYVFQATAYYAPNAKRLSELNE